jgi:hypothetical protein
MHIPKNTARSLTHALIKHLQELDIFLSTLSCHPLTAENTHNGCDIFVNRTSAMEEEAEGDVSI